MGFMQVTACRMVKCCTNKRLRSYGVAEASKIEVVGPIKRLAEPLLRFALTQDLICRCDAMLLLSVYAIIYV